MPSPEWHIALSLGVLLGGALLAGQIAAAMHLPRVTAYLLVGLLFGPYALGSVSGNLLDQIVPGGGLSHAIESFEQHLHYLEPAAKLAMALVLFNMGSHFTIPRFRRIGRRVLPLALGEMGLTFVLVFGGMMLLSGSWPTAVLLGALALATAPATTILVLKESESEGPITEYATALVALNNCVAVVAFEVLFVAAHAITGKLVAPLGIELARLASDLLGSVALGILFGMVTSYSCGLLSRDRWLILLVALATMLLGLCELFRLPYLLTFLAMGVTVANASDRNEDIGIELDRLTGLLCVVFFVLHGSEMDLKALWMAGTVGVAYIVLRSVGKYLGIYLVACSRQDGAPLRKWLGAALLSQAGAAIALSSLAAERDPELGTPLLQIILGTVVFFELLGPIMVRQAVLQTGEMPLDHVIHHTTTTPWEEIQAQFNRLLIAFGRNPLANRSPQEVTIGKVMRTNVKGIPASATFDDVVAFIERSHDNTFPVVGEQNELVGVIRYPDVRDAVFDPELGSLVCAADLALPATHIVHPGDSLANAWEEFRVTHDDAVPVASQEEPHRLIGLVKRRDLLRMFLYRRS